MGLKRVLYAWVVRFSVLEFQYACLAFPLVHPPPRIRIISTDDGIVFPWGS